MRSSRGLSHADDKVVLSNLTFQAAKPVDIRPLEGFFKRDGKTTGVDFANRVFADTKTVTPVADADFKVHPYIASLDLSEIAAIPNEGEGADGGDLKNGKVLGRTRLWLNFNSTVSFSGATCTRSAKVAEGKSTILVNTVLARGIAQARNRLLCGDIHPSEATLGRNRRTRLRS